MENIQSKYGMIKMKELQDKYEENIEKIVKIHYLGPVESINNCFAFS